MSESDRTGRPRPDGRLFASTQRFFNDRGPQGGRSVTEEQHIDEDYFELYLSGQLEAGRATAVEAHFLDCEDCRERLSRFLGFGELTGGETGEVPATGERRSEPRFATRNDGTLQEISPLSLARQQIQIVNFSKSGLGLWTSKFVAPGTLVHLRFGKMVEFGEVRHCTARGDEDYYVGIRLQHRT